MAWHMWAPSSVGLAFYPSADKLGRVRWELPTKLSHPCPAVMAMAKLWPCILWSSTKAQWDPIIFVAAGAAWCRVEGVKAASSEASGKSDFPAPLVCSSSSTSGELWCVCRGKTPHSPLAQAAGTSSCAVPPKGLSGEEEGRAGGV